MQNNIRSDLFETKTLASVAEVSLRQIQWWDEQGVLKARLEGHRRLYTRTDAIVCTVISQLRRRRLSLQNIRPALPTLRRLLGQLATCRGHYLVFAGKVSIVPHKLVPETLSDTTVPSYVLDLGKIAEIIDSVTENA